MTIDTPVAAVVGRLAADPPARAPRLATVRSFDDAAGLGVAEVAGVGEVPFHCTAIADGTRTIPVGATVVCHLAAAHHGRVEAVGLVAVGPLAAARPVEPSTP